MGDQNISTCYSKVSTNYKTHRPSYPIELFQFISSLTPERSLALDVATGSGQAAVNLAKSFRYVKATDLCAEQIGEAPKVDNIEYFHLPAELSEDQCKENGFEANSFDLITCATAIHWIDTKRFFALAQTLLKKPTGIIAILQYVNPPLFDDENIDKILKEYRQQTQPLVHYTITSVTEETYKEMFFPFQNVATSWDIDAKQFKVAKQYCLDDIYGLLSSWSLTVLAKEKFGGDPARDVVEKIRPHWGSEIIRTATYRLFYRIGQNV